MGTVGNMAWKTETFRNFATLLRLVASEELGYNNIIINMVLTIRQIKPMLWQS